MELGGPRRQAIVDVSLVPMLPEYHRQLREIEWWRSGLAKGGSSPLVSVMVSRAEPSRWSHWIGEEQHGHAPAVQLRTYQHREHEPEAAAEAGATTGVE